MAGLGTNGSLLCLVLRVRRGQQFQSPPPDVSRHPLHPKNRKRHAPRETTYDFIRRVKPAWEAPVHLDPIVQILERMNTERVEAVTSTPPRHAKTTTILHAMVRDLERDPTLKMAYITYATELAETKSLDARRIAQDSISNWEAQGIEPPMQLDPERQNLREWRTTKGGMFVATGIGGGLTGMGFNRIVVDDPFKGRTEARSALTRDRTEEWFDSVAYTRRDPRGTSYLVNATRWHIDDLSGRLIRKGWESVNLPAIDGARGALWPSVFTLEELEKIRAHNPKEFAALFQGTPVADGDGVFKGAKYYDTLPEGGYVISVGLDLAYSTKTTADYSVAVVLRLYGNGNAYVVDVLRKRLEAPVFKGELYQFLSQRHSIVSNGRRMLPRVRGYLSGTELGVVSTFRNAADNIGSIPIDAMPCKGDKLTRATDVAAAWNRDAATVYVPREAPWLVDFVTELQAFTGINDEHDDQVDALAGAYVPMVRPPAAPRPFGVPSGFVL